MHGIEGSFGAAGDRLRREEHLRGLPGPEQKTKFPFKTGEALRLARQKPAEYVLSAGAHLAQLLREVSKLRRLDFYPTVATTKDIYRALGEAKRKFPPEEFIEVLESQYVRAARSLGVSVEDVKNFGNAPQILKAKMVEMRKGIAASTEAASGALKKFVENSDGENILSVLERYEAAGFLFSKANDRELHGAQLSLSPEAITQAGTLVDGLQNKLAVLADPKTAATTEGIHESFGSAVADLRAAIEGLGAINEELSAANLKALRDEIRKRYATSSEILKALKGAEKTARRAILKNETDSFIEGVEQLKASRKAVTALRQYLRSIIPIVRNANKISKRDLPKIKRAEDALVVTEQIQRLPEMLVMILERQQEHLRQHIKKGKDHNDFHGRSTDERLRMLAGMEQMLARVTEMKERWEITVKYLFPTRTQEARLH